jgi:hypothetical protein
MLVLIAVIYWYLQKMEKCDCVDPLLVQRLEYTEIGIAGLVALNLIAKIVSGGKFRMMPDNRLAKVGFMTVIIGLFGYLAYLAYNYHADATGCKCADQKAKYVLYAQGTFYAVLVGMVALTMLMK